MKCFFLCLILLLSISLSAFAQNDMVMGRMAISGEEIITTDNRTIKIANIKTPPADEARIKKILDFWIQNKKLILEKTHHDRYGRAVAQISVVDNNKKSWLQAAMIENGLGFVMPADDLDHDINLLIVAEQKARAKKIGIWARDNYAAIAPSMAQNHIGNFQFIVGHVTEVRHRQNNYIFKFSDSPRDFTAIIHARDMKYFRQAKIIPFDYEGKNLRLRGWISKNTGDKSAPFMTITTPNMIEVLRSY